MRSELAQVAESYSRRQSEADQGEVRKSAFIQSFGSSIGWGWPIAIPFDPVPLLSLGSEPPGSRGGLLTREFLLLLLLHDVRLVIHLCCSKGPGAQRVITAS